MTVHFVVPSGVDDPARPSGGNVYDRRVADQLGMRTILAAGAWPQPDQPARADLAAALDALPDGALVLIDGLVGCGVPEVLEPRAARLRIAVLVHLPLAGEVGLPAATAAALDAAERRALAVAEVVVATSRWAARTVAERHGLPADRVRAVAPGVDPPALRPVPDPAGGRLLCVASVTPRKGQDVLVEALASVADLPWGCSCVGPLGADTGYTGTVRALIDHHGLTGRVTLAGPRADVDACYAEADLLVLPSRAETYGMVVAEAAARGVPVLASEVGGVPDALGGAPGLLVPPGDVPALAGALRRWLTDADLRARLRAGTTAARPRTWAECARELAEVLR